MGGPWLAAVRWVGSSSGVAAIGEALDLPSTAAHQMVGGPWLAAVPWVGSSSDVAAVREALDLPGGAAHLGGGPRPRRLVRRVSSGLLNILL